MMATVPRGDRHEDPDPAGRPLPRPVACATTGRLSSAEKLDLYRAHAGAPQSDMQFFGTLNGWTELGDSALAVWTRPSEAYLLELRGPCRTCRMPPPSA